MMIHSELQGIKLAEAGRNDLPRLLTSNTPGNCSQWRALSPADCLNRSGKHTAKLIFIGSFVDYSSPVIQDLVGSAQVIVVQRNLIDKAVWDAIDYWRGLHRIVVADLDDDYPELPWSNPAHEFWIKNAQGLPESPIALLTEGLRHCDGLTSPSKVILDDWKDVVPGYWVPNYAERDWYLKVQPEKLKPGIVTIGWGGSVSHYDSWVFSGIKEALEQVCKERLQVKIKICGNDPRLAKLLNIPNEQLVLQPGVSPQQWPHIVGTFDLGVAPLDMREGYKSYDNHRSWIKAMEYLICGVPWIASKSNVYAELAEHGTVVENTVEDWRDALLKAVDNIEFLKRDAKRKRKYGWGLTLESNLDKVVETYERIGLAAMPNLPQAFYVHWSADSQTLRERQAKAKATLLQETVPPRLENGVLDEIQIASFTASRGWATGADFRGVDLITPMQYDFVQRVNSYLLSKNQKVEAQ